MKNKFLLFAVWLVVFSSALVLIGWAFDINTLKNMSSHLTAMKANTAVCFLLIGIAFLFETHPNTARFRYIFSSLAGLIALLTLSQYVFDSNFGIDTWLYSEPANALDTSYPGRMAPETALCFILLTIATWISNTPIKRQPSEILLGIGLFIFTLALSTIVSYFISSPSLFGWFDFTAMSIHTSILFALLGAMVIVISRQCNVGNTLFQRHSIALDTGAIAVILTVTLSALIVLLQLRQMAETRAVIVTQNLAKTLDISIEGLIDKIAISIQAAADEISREKASNQVDETFINRYLEKQKARLPEADYFYGINEHGDIVYGDIVTPVNISDRKHFITLRETTNHNLITMSAVLSRITNEWIWLTACRINKPDGSFDGIVSAAILLNKINNLFSGIQLSPNDSIALRDTNLGLIARYPSPETANLKIGDNRLSTPFSNALKIDTRFGTYISGITSIDKISRIHSYRKNEKYGFTINVGISKKAALAEWNKQVAIVCSLVIIFVFVVLAFSRMIKRAWLRQAEDFTALQISQEFLYETQKIARLGNYSYHLNSDIWTSSDILDEIFGIDQGYLHNRESWLALIVEESRQEMRAYLHMLIEQHLPFDKEYRIVRVNDGQERWVHGKGKFQFDAHGKPFLLIGTIQDINERKLAEIEVLTLNASLEDRVKQRTEELETANRSLLIAKEAAEAANIAKSTFIATMSHELRTPLNAVLGFSELMSLDVEATTKQKETLKIINASGTHLLSMINEVLEISKIEAGRLELDYQAIDLIKLLQEIGDMINVRALNKQLHFNLEIAAEMPQFITTDSGKLRQVLINLLGNAIKFTSQGVVILRAKIESLTLKIEVIDTGVGIPADKLDKLFKPFMQLTQPNLDTQGTGLGLAISKSLIELMSGKIIVNSKEGIGSTFTIELPIMLANVNDVVINETYRSVKSLEQNQTDWRLLVVDDNSDNRLLLVTILTNVGFQVRESENGQEAIAVFEQWQPHLIWMDMRMPVMDGYEAVAKIRQLPNGEKVKIIAITASVFIEEHKNIIAVGCDAVLHKPFHVPEIFALLTKYIDVKFIYQESIETNAEQSPLKITAEMLVTVPLELRQQLNNAALKLDMEEIKIVIDKIRIEKCDIAEVLEGLLKEYQFEQIIELTMV